MGLLHGRAGRLTAENGGFRRGQMLLMPQHGVGLFVSFNCVSGHGMHRVNPTLFERFLDHFYPMPAPTPAEDDAAPSTPVKAPRAL